LPEATPFVSLYVDGALRGCCGSGGAAPAERLARAFLSAAHDHRFGGTAGSDPVVQVSYLRSIRPVGEAELAQRFEPGTHGLALAAHDRSALLLPQVARDGGLDAAAMVARLKRKAGVGEATPELRFFVFETDEVIVRGEPEVPGPVAAADRAAAWLATLVRPDGQVLFSVDARTRQQAAIGPLHHGRAAVLIRALAAHGGHAAVTGRARARLAAEIRRALAGEPVAGWPVETDRVAGTLALAILAGLDQRAALQAFLAAHPKVAASPWHAAQCLTALGPQGPEPLWRACVADLRARPWAPWTALAAAERRDRAVLARCAPALVESIRTKSPHRGGASVTAVPEVALTAVTVEALAGVKTAAATAACRRARGFLARWQVTPERSWAPIDPRLAVGAFPASPVSYHLRSDITAHALLALLGRGAAVHA